jgi:hypothetical protein
MASTRHLSLFIPRWMILLARPDLQMVDINLRVIYRPNTDKLPQMYRTLGLDYDER